MSTFIETRKRIRGNSVLVFPCLVGLSIDAFQCNVFVSFGRGEQYGRKYDISNHLALAAQDTGWVELYLLGTVNSDLLSTVWLYIAMSCSQMRSNLIGYRGELTNLAHEKA
ncbi:hypothetical protein FOXG_16754 [Fusarium oxysporum f. sp. lycopersici 4287]|uniref:Uncharacterized protein n=2 Tax=Fusarium oxysporum TaxID=5507 RepID=A0A0J9W8D4_FUSO4|nr:hypothetical protein FOXG_16754 [Fusarium oxysporum f. sp. lycopersici 4287]KNB19489.1 hypothetical protein FOXG_16754 [Fusarium oxysporum f. sp. lycopersici 4287]